MGSTLSIYEMQSTVNVFYTQVPSTLGRRNLKTQQSPVILHLCLRKTRSGKSHDNRDAEKLLFQNVFRPHENEKPAISNSTGRKSSVFVTD